MPRLGVTAMNRPSARCVFLVVDGLGDRPSQSLGGLTPLEAADTPLLDRLAAAGEFGLVDPIAPGRVPNTDSGIGVLLGLPTGQIEALHRGPVEASGAGLALRSGDVAMRANFATVERRPDGLWILDRRAGRIDKNTGELADCLDGIDLGDGVQAIVRSTDQHRAVIVLRGPGLDGDLSDTDPGDAAVPGFVAPSRAIGHGAGAAADKVNRLIAESHARLADHPVNRERAARGLSPANAVITRGAGGWFAPANLVSERGLRAATVAGCNTVLGLARLFGFDTIEAPGFTASRDTDIEGKVAAAIEACGTRDLVYLHYKAPDLCAHDRDPLAKRDCLERLDRALAPLESAGLLVALASDHTTDSATGMHTDDPVPALLYDPRAAARRPLMRFGESACRQGPMPRQSGTDLLLRVLARMGS